MCGLQSSYVSHRVRVALSKDNYSVRAYLNKRCWNPPAAERCVRSWTTWSIYATFAALAPLTLCASLALALDSPAPELASATMQAGAPGANAAPSTDSDEVETPDSTEQGQTQMKDSFEHRPVAALLHESKLVGLRDTTLNVELRTEFLNRENFDETASETWALGGSAVLRPAISLISPRSAQPATPRNASYGPLDKDGAKLLQPGQEQYTVMGELYGQFKLTDEIVAVAGRRVFDTPFINTQDSLMTPNTFTMYAVQGLINNTDETSTLRFAVGYVDKMKPRNAQDFESMATAAGAPGRGGSWRLRRRRKLCGRRIRRRRDRLLQPRHHQYRLLRNQIRRSACPAGDPASRRPIHGPAQHRQ